MLAAASKISPLPPELHGPAGTWATFVAFLVRRRVRITLLVFLVLILEDVVMGIKPHSPANFSDPKSLIGMGLVFAGLALRSWSAGILRKTEMLTTTGPYALVRHPLYIGSFMIMVGFCTLIDDPENIFFVLGPFVLLYFYQVLHEERILSNRYGVRWDEYARSAPRFLPYRISRDAMVAWNPRAWLGNRENQAVAGVFLGLTAIQLWHLS